MVHTIATPGETPAVKAIEKHSNVMRRKNGELIRVV